MDSMRLLDQARGAGLEVSTEGDRLVIRGPKTGDAIARQLLERKAEVVPTLQAEAEYNRLDDELCNLVGTALDARDRGDEAEHQRLMGEAERLWKGPHAAAKRRLRAAGGRVAGLIWEENGELTRAKEAV